MLESIYHMLLRFLLNLISGVKKFRIYMESLQRCYGSHFITLAENL